MNGGTHQTSEKAPLHAVVRAVNVCRELQQTTCVNGGWVTTHGLACIGRL